MLSHFLPPFIASLFAATTTTIGIFIIHRFEDWARKYVVYFTSFAAGVLVSVSFLHIVPESFSMNRISAPACLLIGYLFMHFLNRFITRYVCDTPLNRGYTFGLIPMFGIGFHSFIDGIIYAITFAVSPFMGILAVSGMILHEFPEGVVTYVLLVRSGFKSKTSFLLAFLAAALTTPLGVIVASPFLQHISDTTLGILLSLSAGCLVYVGATHLLPHVEREEQKYSVIALVTGVIVAVLIVSTKV
jgi:zinc and cadmium transporter